jgi:ATP-binding cassette, subfamily B, bacterial RamB/AmfA
VIAHRMSSALHADRVLVLDGTAPQFGDHATLLACSPLYRDLVGHWQPDPGPGGPVPATFHRLTGAPWGV